MSKFLITGCSGFIGSHFYNSINHQEIVNLDLNAPAFSHKSVYIQGDIRNPKDVRRALQSGQIDTIISLAAKHHDFGIGHDEYFDTNEDGTKVLCGVASELGIKKIIFYSSVAVYGELKQTSSEEVLPMPNSPYGASKLAGEKVLRNWYEQDKSRTVIIIRPTVVYGANNVANMYSLIRQIDSGFFFHIGSASNIKSIAYVENLVSATLWLNRKLNSGFHIYNYADEPQLSSKQIATIIAETLNKRIRITLPLFLALIFSIPFDIFIKLTGKNLPISSARVKKLNTQTSHSAKKLFSENFTPKYSNIEGLKKMVAWYQNNRLVQD